MKLNRLIAFVLFVAIFAASCSSSTIIRTTDPDVKIYVDGEYKGKGSVTQSDTKTIFSSTSVRLEKTGCETTNETISRSEFDVGACIGGVFLLFPFLWIEKYKPEHNFEFTCHPVSSR